jgi:hypothetical protein
MRVDENVVNILLFWHTNITDEVYKIRLNKSDLRQDESIIYVSDGEIYFNGQFVEPIMPFKLDIDVVGGFRLKYLDKYCYTINVIALSLAVNGAHLLY